MTIYEAIAHAREVAEKQRKDNDNCEYKAEYGCKGCADYYSKPCIECAEEHEQLAEWLGELKDYRDKNKMVVRIDCVNSEEFKDIAVKLAKEQYNKAIDDYKSGIKEELERFEVKNLDTCVLYDLMDRKAERLKEGVYNEISGR